MKIFEKLKKIFKKPKKEEEQHYIYHNGKAYKFGGKNIGEWTQNYWAFMVGTAIDDLKYKEIYVERKPYHAITVKELHQELGKVIADGYGNYGVKVGYGRFEFSGEDYEVNDKTQELILAEE